MEELKQRETITRSQAGASTMLLHFQSMSQSKPVFLDYPASGVLL
jgi:hypothetical protein